METLNYIAYKRFKKEYAELEEHEQEICHYAYDNLQHRRNEQDEWEATRESKVIRFDIT